MKKKVAFANPKSILAVLLAASTLGVLAADYQSIVLSDSPVAYWRLSEAVGPVLHDLVGGHDGTALNGVIFGRPGALANDGDTACGFNGSNGIVQVPYSPDLNVGTFSVECWARYTNTSAYGGGGQVNSEGGPTTGYKISIWDVTWQFIIHSYGPGWGNLSSPRITVNQWTHLVGTFDGTNQSFYVDGVLAGAFVDTSFVPNVSNVFYIGANFGGDLDEVAIYNYALTADQVAFHYAFGQYNTNSPPLVLREAASQTAQVGSPAVLSPDITGSPPLDYQWWKDGAPLAGATHSILTLTNSAYEDTGIYWLAVTNNLGSTNSQPIKLAVMPPPLFCNLTNGLVLHLNFDGNYLDTSGRTNNGTPMGSPVFTNGVIGSAALHYNTDVARSVYNYVTLGNPTDLKFSSNVNFSVAYWVRFTGTPGDLPFLCNSVGSFGTPGFAFAPSYKLGGWSWSFWSTSPGNVSSSSIQVYGPNNSINDGNWHHLVHSFDREGSGITYLDGVEVDLTSILRDPTQSLDRPGPINIGQDASGRYRESGAIDLDDLGVWRRALTAYEAQSIYSVGRHYGRSFDTYGPVQLMIQNSPVGIEIIWQAGTLETADELVGPWQLVTDASAPYYKLPTQGSRKFYRARL